MTGFDDKSNTTHPSLNRHSPPRFLFLLSALIWTLAIVGMACRHYHSTHGLGLTLVKNIVEQHHGRIWFESAGIGTGCCFYFTLLTTASAGGNKP